MRKTTVPIPQRMNVRRIREADLPLSCPLSDAPVWNLHPRVFLRIDRHNREQSCPYCGMHYVLDVTDENGG